MQVQALTATAVLTAQSASGAEAAAAEPAPKATFDAIAVLMHLGCI